MTQLGATLIRLRGRVAGGTAHVARFIKGPSLVYLAATVVGRVGTLALLPTYTRRMTAAEYGEYALAQTLVVFGASLFSFSLPAAITRFYFDSTDVAVSRERSGSVARWLSLLAAATSLTFIACIQLLAPDGVGLFTRSGLTSVALGALGGALSAVPFAYFRAQQRAYHVAAFQMIDFFSVTGFGVWFVVVSGRGLDGALDAIAFAAAPPVVASLLLVWVHMKGRLDVSVLRAAFGYGYPVALQVYAGWLLNVADRWSLKLSGHDADVGRYAVAAQVTMPLSMPAAAWNEAEYARLGEVFRREGLAGVGVAIGPMSKSFFTLCVLPAAALVAVLPLAARYLGDAGDALHWIVPVLIVATIIDAQVYPFQNVLYYAAKTRRLNLVTASTVVVSLLLMLLLVPFFGVPGALAAKVLTSSARFWATRRAALLCISEAHSAAPAPSRSTGDSGSTSRLPNK